MSNGIMPGGVNFGSDMAMNNHRRNLQEYIDIERRALLDGDVKSASDAANGAISQIKGAGLQPTVGDEIQHRITNPTDDGLIGVLRYLMAVDTRQPLIGSDGSTMTTGGPVKAQAGQQNPSANTPPAAQAANPYGAPADTAAPAAYAAPAYGQQAGGYPTQGAQPINVTA